MLQRIETSIRSRLAATAWVPLLLGGVLGSAIAVTWHSWATLYSAPPLAPIGAALLVLLLCPPRSLAVWAVWATAGVTLLWSAAPGNTLATSLWLLLPLAAFGLGRVPIAFWGLLAGLLGVGLLDGALVSNYGLQLYSSGSPLYLTGALTLLAIPQLLREAARRRGSGRLLALLAFGALLFAALMSGARAVYLPLALALPVAALRAILDGIPVRRLALTLAGAVVLVGAVDGAWPAHPVRTALIAKGAVSAADAASGGAGNVGSRLAMWRQTLDLALERPQGFGAGTFREVLPANLATPMLAFGSAHNTYLEWAATGGWLHLLAFLALLLPVLWRGWSGDSWPLALGAGAYWMTAAFDVSGYYPAFLALGFWALGVLAGAEAKRVSVGAAPAWGWQIAAIVPAVLVAWWFLPCGAGTCAVTRHLGFGPSVHAALEGLPPERHPEMLRRALDLHPDSIAYHTQLLALSVEPAERLQRAEALVERFPLLHPHHYLTWARAALDAGAPAEARAALEAGRHVFPPDFRPAGVPLADRSEDVARFHRQAAELERRLVADAAERAQ